MIRNVVMGEFRDDLSDDERRAVEVGLAGIGGLELPGLVSMTIGRDLGLREGGWSFAIVNDWRDADAYRNYDLDAEHNQYRAAVGAGCSRVARVQFEVPGA